MSADVVIKEVAPQWIDGSVRTEVSAFRLTSAAFFERGAPC